MFMRLRVQVLALLVIAVVEAVRPTVFLLFYTAEFDSINREVSTIFNAISYTPLHDFSHSGSLMIEM